MSKPMNQFRSRIGGQRQRRRFSSRRAVRRLIAAAGEHFAKQVQTDPDFGHLLHVPRDFAINAGMMADLRRLAFVTSAEKDVYVGLIFGRDA